METGATSPPAFVPTGQPDNSPAFQRRVSVGVGTSPTGTAERTTMFPPCPSISSANLNRPSGTWNLGGLNPALKCRAVVIASLCDGQTPFALIVHPKLNSGKSRYKCGVQSAPKFDFSVAAFGRKPNPSISKDLRRSAGTPPRRMTRFAEASAKVD